MLMLKSPSYVLNSHDVPGPKYRMWETTTLHKGATATDVVHHIARANRLALEHERSQLMNIVINCHGSPGSLAVGGSGKPGIDQSTVGAFSVLNKKNLGTIWLVACKAAQGTAGKSLCEMLAKVCMAQVVAAETNQSVGVWGSLRILQGGGRGQIDEYEGTVYRFTPAGGYHIIDPHEAIYTILE